MVFKAKESIFSQGANMITNPFFPAFSGCLSDKTQVFISGMRGLTAITMARTYLKNKSRPLTTFRTA